MKNFIQIICFMFFTSSILATPISENFDSFTGSGYSTHYYSGWTIVDGLSESSKARTGRAVRLDRSPTSGQALISPSKTGGVGVVSFWYRHWDGDANTLAYDVEVSSDSSVWTNVGTITGFNSTTYTQFTATVNNASAKYVRVIHVSGSERFIIDDFSITDATGGCTGYYRDSIGATICTFDSIGFRGAFYQTAGIYRDTVNSTCDTIFVLNLNTVTEVVYDLFDTICSVDDSLLFDGNYLKSAGIYYDTIARTGNCDSVVKLSLYVKYCPVACSEIYISEYIEGSSNNKALEFYNPTADSIDLSTYKVVIYRSSNDTISLSGFVKSYDVHVISHPSAALTGITSNSDATAPIYFNGDDRIALLKGNVVIDVFGDLSGTGNFAKDQTFHRDSSIQSGTTSYNLADWVVLPSNTDTLIGSHTGACAFICTPTRDTVTTSICMGDSATNGVKYYTTAGFNSDTLTSASGCDSIRVLNLTVNVATRDTITTSICMGDSATNGVKYYTTAGFNSDTLTSTLTGCDSIRVLNLTVTAISRDTVTASVCEGDSATNGVNYYTTAGFNSDTLTSTITGCDSIRVLNLTVLASHRDTTVSSVCEGDSATNGVNYYSVTGIYSDTLTSTITGCDSIRVLDLTVNLITRDTVKDTICQGASSMIGTTSFNTTGNYVDTLASIAGCDSIVVLQLYVNDYLRDTIQDTICQGASISLGTQTLTTTGNYIDTLQTSLGCDSIVVLNLYVNDYLRDTVQDTICENATLTFGSQTLSIAGTYIDTAQNAGGCDSITVLTLVVNTVSRDTITNAICSGDSVLFGGTYYSVTGNYSDTNTSITGCDSIRVLQLTVISYPITTLNVQGCDTYTLVGGRTVNFSGAFIDTLTAITGCDSVVKTNVTLHYSSRVTDTVTACNSYTSPSGKVWYTSGTRVDTIPTKLGCDSIITVVLTVHLNSATTRTISSCFSYTVPETGRVYTTSGTYKDTGVNAYGCDFVITTVLTINVVNAGTISLSGTTYTAAATGVGYKWADCSNNYSHILGDTNQTFSPNRNGNFACIITSPEGCSDTTNCLAINTVSLEEYEITEDNISIYPNPATEAVTIDILSQNVDEDVTIRVFDAIGKLVYSQEVSSVNNKVMVNLEGLESGTYTVSVSNQFFYTTKKLAVVK